MEPEGYQERADVMIQDLAYNMGLGPTMDTFDELIKSLKEFDIIDDGLRHPLHPKQKIFLELLEENKDDKYVLSDQDKICIIHCLKYGHYSDIHRDTLNKLIRKYAR